MKRGSKSPFAKSQRNAVIVRLYKKGHTIYGLAKRYNISETRIRQIIKTDEWRKETVTIQSQDLCGGYRYEAN